MTRLLSILFLLVASVAQAQLQAPLDTAAFIYRAQPYDPELPLIPNEGTRTEPLVLSNSPAFGIDSIAGPALDFSGFNTSSYIPVSGSVFDGDFTYALRWRPVGSIWTGKTLGMLWYPPVPPSTTTAKYFYLYQDTQCKYFSRFWANTPQTPQIPVQGISTVNLLRADTVVVTWSNSDNTNRLYVNGILEGSASHPSGRLPNNPVYYPGRFEIPPPPASQYSPTFSGMMGSIAIWNDDLSPSQIQTLVFDNDDWYSSGGAPPPHVGVFVLRRTGMDDEPLPAGTTITRNGVALDPPTGTEDVIIEIETP